MEGVPYFSREEEAQARANAAFRRNRYNVPDIRIREDDAETSDFLGQVQHQIHVWMSKGMVSFPCFCF